MVILSYLTQLHKLICVNYPNKLSLISSVRAHTQFDSFSTLMLTWLKLGWEEYRLWVRSEWLDTVHVESGLSCEGGKKKMSRHYHRMSRAADLCQWHGRPAGNLQCKPLRWAFSCVACRPRGLQVLVLAWQPPPLDLPEQLFVTIPPSLWPLSFPPSPWWLGWVLPVLGGPCWLWQLCRGAWRLHHTSVQYCQGTWGWTGLWILHSVREQCRSMQSRLLND